MTELLWFLRKLFSAKYVPSSLRAMRRITVFGIALAVMSLVLIVSASSGFKKVYKESILNFNAHLVIMDAPGEKFVDQLKNSSKYNNEFWFKHVQGMTPFIYEEALISSEGAIRGVVVKGVDSKSITSVNKMDFDLVTSDLTLSFDSIPRSVILGKHLAININAKIGDVMKIFIPNKNDFVDVNVVGLFESGLYDYDAKFLLMRINDVRQLFGISDDRLSGIEIRLDDPDLSSRISEDLFNEFPEIGKPVTWFELNRDLFSAVKLEGIISSILVGILVIVSAFNIITVLIIFVIYRRVEIAVLSSLGMDRSSRERLVSFGGLSLGLRGVAIGLILGAFLGFVLMKWRLIKLPADVYFVDALPVDVSYFICLMVLLFGILASLLASIVASKKASKMTVVEALRDVD